MRLTESATSFAAFAGAISIVLGASLTGWSQPATTNPTGVGAGWQVILPGAITGSPTPVDLDGDGKMEIVVPYMGMAPEGRAGGSSKPPSGPQSDLAARILALHQDGSTVNGWPITLMTAEEHAAAAPSEYPNWWIGTPAVVDAPPGGQGIVVINHPGGPGKGNRGMSVIRGDGNEKRFSPNIAYPDPGTTFALADLKGNGTLCIFGGQTSCTIDGEKIPDFRAGQIPAGFSSSAGDIDGDGKPEVFLITQRHGASSATLNCYDSTGKMKPGWPQKIGGKSFAAPSLGNVFGDEKREVILPDHHGHILAWTCDGQRFGNTFVEAQGVTYNGDTKGLGAAALEAEKCTSIFKDKIECAGPVSLADLDGDGLAEIIAIDANNATLCAWHGDGTGIGNADGVLAHLGSGDVHGVSVAGPDDAGGFDFFAGRWWIHRNKGGTTTTKDMAPPSASASGATTQPAQTDTMCQDTLCDLAGDGHAEVLIGTTDGRLIVYPTGLKYTPAWAQWPMLGGNPQHTGVWHKPGR